MKTCRLIIFLIVLPFFTDAQIITLFAGGGTVEGDGGAATSANIPDPDGGIFDRDGNYYFVSNLGGNRVRKVDLAGIITTVAGTGVEGYNGDGILATTAQLNLPSAVIFDTVGNLYICEGQGNRIRKVDMTTGIISTIVGNGTPGYGGDGGLAIAAVINDPQDICFDKFGNLYIGDYNNSRVRKVNTAGIITTLVGTGVPGYSGDGSLADTSKIGGVEGICADTAGNIFLADNSNSRVFKINTSGIITTFAGTSTGYLFNGDGIPATTANIDPGRITFDDTGNLLITETYNYRVRKVDIFGVIHTIAGNGIAGSSGEGGPALDVEMNYPSGVAFDPCGNLYVPETGNKRVSKITLNPLSVTPTPTVSISATTSDTVCSATLVTYSAIVTGGGSSATIYEWYVDGASVSTSGSSYSYTPANGDSIRCTIISVNPCSYSGTAISNTIHMVVDTATTPSMHIFADSGDTICIGTLVTFAAATTGAGTTPSYQWIVNGSYVGTGGSAYAYTPANGDSIRCILTSSAPCTTATTISSNTLIMSVGASESPGIFITVNPGDSVCIGTPATFTASISLGGISPLYQWKVNGINTGTSSNIYSYSPANNDSIRCILTSSASCAIPAIISSNIIDMVVDTFIVPAITLTSSATAAVGSIVTVNAAIADAGSSYSINWYNNGVLFNTTTIPVITYTKAAGTDNITATIIPTSPRCYDSTTSSVFIITSLNAGVNNIGALSLHIYPNPGTTTLHIDNVTTTQAGYRLLSIVGAVLLQGTLQPGNNNISIQALSPGIYILEVTDPFTGFRITNKIVKE